MSLIELQRDFRRHILDGSDEIAARMPDRAQRGLRLYRHAYRATLIDTLRDTYPKTAAWLGDEAFEAAATAYVARHPPSSWTLADYGRGFADALTDRYPDDPEVGELAWLDRALRHAFPAADLPAVDPAALATIDWEVATIHLAPSVAARATRTNVVAIWNALAAERIPPPCDVDLPGGLLVWRSGLSPVFRTTTPAETAALIATLSRKSFAQTCASVEEGYGLAAEDMGAILGGEAVPPLDRGAGLGEALARQRRDQRRRLGGRRRPEDGR